MIQPLPHMRQRLRPTQRSSHAVVATGSPLLQAQQQGQDITAHTAVAANIPVPTHAGAIDLASATHTPGVLSTAAAAHRSTNTRHCWSTRDISNVEHGSCCIHNHGYKPFHGCTHSDGDKHNCGCTRSNRHHYCCTRSSRHHYCCTRSNSITTAAHAAIATNTTSATHAATNPATTAHTALATSMVAKAHARATAIRRTLQ